MATPPTSTHPAVQYLKNNAVLIGLIVTVTASVGAFALSQGGDGAEPAAQSVPAVSATASIAGGGPGTSASPSAGPVASAGATAPAEGPEASAPAAGGPGQASSSATPHIIGNGQQAVIEKDWKPYARDFATAWIDTSGGKEAWLKRLKPLVSAGLYEGLQATDIRTIPTDTFDAVTLADSSPGLNVFRAFFVTHSELFEARAQIQPDGSWVIDQLAPPRR